MLVLHNVYFIITSFIHQIDKTKSIISVCVKWFYMNSIMNVYLRKIEQKKSHVHVYNFKKKIPLQDLKRNIDINIDNQNEKKWSKYLKISRKTIDANVCTRLEIEVISLRKPFTILPRRIKVMNMNHLIEKLYNWYVF